MFDLEWLNVITSLRIYVSSMYALPNATNTRSFPFLKFYDIRKLKLKVLYKFQK